MQTSSPSVNSLAAELQALEAQVVERLGDLEFTRGELRVAFERVAPKDHWKGAIDATVELTERERLAVHLAVPFFTGSRATLEHVRPGVFRVRAAGYYAAVGA